VVENVVEVTDNEDINFVFDYTLFPEIRDKYLNELIQTYETALNSLEKGVKKYDYKNNSNTSKIAELLEKVNILEDQIIAYQNEIENYDSKISESFKELKKQLVSSSAKRKKTETKAHILKKKFKELQFLMDEKNESLSFSSTESMDDG